MTVQELSNLLVQHAKCEKDGDQLKVPGGIDLSLWVALGAESLVIDKVSVLHLDPTVLIAVTGRQERFLVNYADVRAVRVSPRGNSTGYAS